MLRALLITVSNAGSDGAYSAVLTEKIQETTRIMTRLTPQQRHDLEESRRRAIAQLSKAELSTPTIGGGKPRPTFLRKSSPLCRNSERR